MIRYERWLSPLPCLAITAALEYFTAVFAETLLSDERAQALLGSTEVRSMLLWHAIEEPEHRAVAFDVYRAAGGTERRRIWAMRAISASFFTAIVVNTTLSLLGDRATYNPIRLGRSLAAIPRSPFLTCAVQRLVGAYAKRGYHPDDSDNAALLAHWTAALFGEKGRRWPGASGEISEVSAVAPIAVMVPSSRTQLSCRTSHSHECHIVRIGDINASMWALRTFRQCQVWRVSYHWSPTGSPARFQLQDCTGVMCR